MKNELDQQKERNEKQAQDMSALKKKLLALQQTNKKNASDTEIRKQK